MASTNAIAFLLSVLVLNCFTVFADFSAVEAQAPVPPRHHGYNAHPIAAPAHPPTHGHHHHKPHPHPLPHTHAPVHPPAHAPVHPPPHVAPIHPPAHSPHHDGHHHHHPHAPSVAPVPSPYHHAPPAHPPSLPPKHSASPPAHAPVHPPPHVAPIHPPAHSPHHDGHHHHHPHAPSVAPVPAPYHHAPPAHPPSLPPKHSASPPAHAPAPLPPKKPFPRSFVAVQGVVYCKSCKYAGVDTLLNATALSGATVKVQCNNTKYPLTVTGTTDKNGYFFITAPKTITTFGAHKCKASLLSAKTTACSKITNLHGGLTGALLKPTKAFMSEKKLPFLLYTVGPFAFESKCPK